MDLKTFFRLIGEVKIMDFKEKEVLVKSVEKKEAEGKPDYYVVTTQDGERYSAWPPREDATEEQIEKFHSTGKLKWGNKIKIYYAEGKANPRTGKPYLNLYDFEHISQVDAPEVEGVPPVAHESRAAHEGGSRTSSIVAQAIIKSQLFAVVVDTMYKANDGMDPDMDLILEAARKKMVTLYKELKAEVEE